MAKKKLKLRMKSEVPLDSATIHIGISTEDRETVSTAFQAAAMAGDESTADLMTQRLQSHEKTAWMLRSMLK